MNPSTKIELASSWVIALPALVIFGGAVIGVLFEAFMPKSARREVQILWSVLVVLGAIAALAWRSVTPLPQGVLPIVGAKSNYELIEHPVSLAFSALILGIALLSILVMADRTALGDGAFAAQPADRPGSGEEGLSIKSGAQRSEVFPLALFSVGGMLIFVSTASLLTMFVALEVFSLPLYILAASARRQRLLSQEAALKYFLMGAFSSAFFLMGMAFVFGATGSLSLIHASEGVSKFTTMPGGGFALIGLVLILVGLLFKVGAVPFHAWTPDVYTGAPTPVTGFMAAAVKVAAFGALLTISMTILSPQLLAGPFRAMMWVIVIATIVVGTVVGLVQSDLKRMIAYSSIAHGGFLLIGLLSLGIKGTKGFHGNPFAIGSIWFYLVVYSLATIGAFALITLVRKSDEAGNITLHAT